MAKQEIDDHHEAGNYLGLDRDDDGHWR